MIRYLFILLFICLTLTNCGQTQLDKNQALNSTNKSLLGSDTASKSTNQEVFQIDYIIFGRYCGECGNHCAIMYQYNCGGNANTLLVDSTDSYFKNNGKIIFKKAVADTKKFFIARSIFQEIPPQLLTTNNLTASFGCPDCTDGCGLYFEIKQSDKIKKFYIDYQTGQLVGDIKKFAEFLKATIAKLNEENL